MLGEPEGDAVSSWGAGKGVDVVPSSQPQSFGYLDGEKRGSLLPHAVRPSRW